MPRVAIATPNLNAWSETFIAAHLKLIPERVLLFSDGKPPRQVNGRAINLPVTTRERLQAHWDVRVLNLSLSERLRRNTERLLTRERIQVVLAEYGPMAASMVKICVKTNIPLVAHFHGYDAHMHETVKQWGNYAELFEHAAAIIAVSKHMRQTLIALGAPAQKVFYLPYGIDISAFTPSPVRPFSPHFLAVGRFVDKKAPLITLAAFREVLNAHPDAQLTMVGDGPLREACVQLVEAWGIHESVHIKGVATPQEIVALMRNSLAFVQHSTVTANGDSEGTPLAVLEAMACGIPVVATRHAGIPDVVENGQEGFLCNELDLLGMVRHMSAFIENPNKAREMGAAARRKVMQEHNVVLQVEKLFQILQQVSVPT